jgi:hypothetical protein
MAANSHEAISTALQFASARFGRTLTLYGTQEFQRLAVETAVNKGLAINFADPTLDAYREKLLLDKHKIAFNHRKQQSLTHSQKGEEISQSRHEMTSAAESPIKAFEPTIDPLQEWKGANPEMVQTYSLEGEGKVLHVLSDGRWIQNKGRGKFSIHPSSPHIETQIGNNVIVAKDGRVRFSTDLKVELNPKSR